MSGFTPAMAIPVLSNPVTVAASAGVAVMLGLDYQSQQREVALAFEGWQKGDATSRSRVANLLI